VSSLFRKLVCITAKALVTGLGTGYSPWAPGTCGSLLALTSAWLLFPASWWAVPLAVMAACLAGVPLSFWAERRWGSDPPRVVIDEVAGQWLALFLVPKSAIWFPLAFLVFRLFDITKPLGIFRVQEAPGGWGVVLDDLLAGAYSNIVLQAGMLLFCRKASALAGLLGLS
jgi:phosphatidylglycerophosphatase A